MTKQPLYRQAKFLKSVASLDQLPEDQNYEVAFAGYSNVGKSSVINAVTGIKHLARVSKTPGRTQMINFFMLDEKRRLVDLPGYGFANVPQAMKKRWEKHLASYLETRTCLRGLVLLMDIRHPLKVFDQQMIAWAVKSQLPIHVLLTKSDKLSYGATKKVLDTVNAALANYHEQLSFQAFSAVDHRGLAVLYDRLNHWLRLRD